MRGVFTTADAGLARGDWVLAQTPRGIEQGRLIANLQTVPPRFEGEERNGNSAGRILERLDPAAVQVPWHQSGRFSQEYDQAAREIDRLGLPMKLTDVEVLPRRDKAVFYFLADGRIDFRQLVRTLARALHLRVEMKQIGVRDEARLKGTCGHCGRALCCSSWMHKMEPVNMRMAKVQKTTLDPDKISGRCGRLLCCLRYEAATYWENRKLMPSRGARVATPAGPGQVLQQDLLSCRVLVGLDKGSREYFPLDQLGEEGTPVEVPRESSADQTPAAREGRESIMPAPFAEDLLGTADPEGSDQADEQKRSHRKRRPRRRRRNK
jgi:cell fate regulator YaaT (PSP1 superfamily)